MQFYVGNTETLRNGFSDNRNIFFLSIGRFRNAFQNFGNSCRLIRIVGKNNGSPAVHIRLFKFFFQIFYVSEIALRRFGGNFDMRLFGLYKIIYINRIKKYGFLYVLHRIIEFQ